MTSGSQQNTYCEEKYSPTFQKRNATSFILCACYFTYHMDYFLKKVHRIVSLREPPFLKDYILTLTHLRSRAAERILTFFVNVFKSIPNSTCGIFAQTPKKFTFVKLCFCEKDLKKPLILNGFYLHVL